MSELGFFPSRYTCTQNALLNILRVLRKPHGAVIVFWQEPNLKISLTFLALD